MALKKSFYLLLLVTIGIVLETKLGNAAPPEGFVPTINFHGYNIILQEIPLSASIGPYNPSRLQNQIIIQVKLLKEVQQNYTSFYDTVMAEHDQLMVQNNEAMAFTQSIMRSMQSLSPDQIESKKPLIMQKKIELNNACVRLILRCSKGIAKIYEDEIQTFETELNQIKNTELAQRANDPKEQDLAKVKRDEAYALMNLLEQKVRDTMHYVRERHLRHLQFDYDKHLAGVQLYKNYFGTFKLVALEVKRKRAGGIFPFQQQRGGGRGQFGPQVGSNTGNGGFKKNIG